jgi:hypothetical protein
MHSDWGKIRSKIRKRQHDHTGKSASASKLTMSKASARSGLKKKYFNHASNMRANVVDLLTG